jgi:hypothetical protein
MSRGRPRLDYPLVPAEAGTQHALLRNSAKYGFPLSRE